MKNFVNIKKLNEVEQEQVEGGMPIMVLYGILPILPYVLYGIHPILNKSMDLE